MVWNKITHPYNVQIRQTQILWNRSWNLTTCIGMLSCHETSRSIFFYRVMVRNDNSFCRTYMVPVCHVFSFCYYIQEYTNIWLNLFYSGRDTNSHLHSWSHGFYQGTIWWKACIYRGGHFERKPVEWPKRIAMPLPPGGQVFNTFFTQRFNTITRENSHFTSQQKPLLSSKYRMVISIINSARYK